MDKKFEVIVLGSAGGLSEDNLTSYLVTLKGGTRFLAVDAGSIFSGLKKAASVGSLDRFAALVKDDLSLEGWVLRECIRAYLISHAHLDHIAGLVINSTDDGSKPILGMPTTIDYLRDHIFNWKIWPNFGNEGEAPPMNKYHYTRLTARQQYTVADTGLSLTPFQVSHAENYESTAFLLQANDAFLLFIGDTGPDSVEKSKNLDIIWHHITPLIRNHKLHGLFLEASYPDGRPDELLFGHLTPAWMMHELTALANLVDSRHPETALQEVPIVVTSIKPSLQEGCMRDRITRQLRKKNALGIEFIVPAQGELLLF